MKNIFATILLLGCVSIVSAQKKDSPKKADTSTEKTNRQNASPANKNASVKEAGSDAPKMKQYFFVMLTKGPNRSQDSTTAANLQKGHMDNLGNMAKKGKLLVAGPFGDDGDWRGIFILDCATKEEAEALVKADPAVQAGRLGYEIRPWWTMTNAVFK
jgi:uncharacterized protein YciI